MSNKSKGFKTKEELQKLYPKGKIEIKSKIEIYTCPKRSLNWERFNAFVYNNPFIISIEETETEKIAYLQRIETIYDISEYVYFDSTDRWFPINNLLDEKDIMEFYAEEVYLPPTYEEVKKEIENNCLTIYREQLYGEKNELHFKH